MGQWTCPSVPRIMGCNVLANARGIMGSDDVSFYASVVKTLFLYIVLFITASLIGVIFFIGGYTAAGVVCMVIAGLLLVVTVFFIEKGLLHPNPYLMLTDEELIIGSIVRDKTHTIEWDDIIGYNILKMEFRTYIEINLYDEKKYLDRKFGRKRESYAPTHTTLFSIVWGMIKQEDRRKFVHEMDKRTQRGYQLTHEFFPQTDAEQEKRKRKSEHRLDNAYLLKTSIYSLVLAGFMALLYSRDGGADTLVVVVSFILYPFAKILFDCIVGFKIKDKLENQTGLLIMNIYAMLFIVDIILFMTSFYVGPVGILFLIVWNVFRYLKGKKRGE